MAIEQIKFVPTQEQINAAKERREKQQAEKKARQNKAGGKTVQGKDGKYKSVTVTPKQVEAKQKQRIEQNLKKQQHYGGKTIFDKETGKYISQSAEEVKSAAKTTKKSGGFLNNLGKISKKAGKFGLIGAGIALLIGGGVALYNKLSENKEQEPAQTPENKKETETTKLAVPEDKKETETTKPAAPEDKKETETTKPAAPENKKETETTKPAAPEDKKETETTKPTVPENKKETEPSKPAEQKEYTVVKGDNVWNIAKQHLKDMNTDPNYKPTNAEILKHTKELMELNNLKFEPDGYHVMIRPNDKLKLVA